MFVEDLYSQPYLVLELKFVAVVVIADFIVLLLMEYNSFSFVKLKVMHMKNYLKYPLITDI